MKDSRQLDLFKEGGITIDVRPNVFLRRADKIPELLKQVHGVFVLAKQFNQVLLKQAIKNPSFKGPDDFVEAFRDRKKTVAVCLDNIVNVTRDNGMTRNTLISYKTVEPFLTDGHKNLHKPKGQDYTYDDFLAGFKWGSSLHLSDHLRQQLDSPKLIKQEKRRRQTINSL